MARRRNFAGEDLVPLGIGVVVGFAAVTWYMKSAAAAAAAASPLSTSTATTTLPTPQAGG